MNWMNVHLGDICELQNGYAFKSAEYTNDGYFLMRITNVQQGFISNHNPKFVSIPANSKLEQFILNEGDILMSLTGDVGRVGVINKHNLPAVLNQRVARIIIKNKIEIDKNFLFNLLNSDSMRKEIESMGHGAAQLNVSTKDILSIKVSIPPLEIQKKIVLKTDALLLEIEKVKAATKSNIKNIEILFQSYLSKVFGARKQDSKKIKLKELCDFKQGIQVEVSKQLASQSENNVRFLRIIDFTAGNEEPRYIENPGEQYAVKSNDVSLVRYGASTGFVCRGLEGVIANNLFQVKPKSNLISKECLFWYLYSPEFQEFIKNKMSGVAMPAINFGMLNDFEMNLYDESEQASIVKNCEGFDSERNKLKAILEDKLNQLDSLRNSILQKVLSGELIKE